MVKMWMIIERSFMKSRFLFLCLLNYLHLCLLNVEYKLGGLGYRSFRNIFRGSSLFGVSSTQAIVLDKRNNFKSHQLIDGSLFPAGNLLGSKRGLLA